jgi:beta-glucosidase
MAATWNPELMKKGAEIAAMETRAAAIPWSFSPVLDIGRQPLWPRFYETFGEDPYLAKVMGVAFVRGLEGTDVSSQEHVAASLKHYMGYSFSFNGRDRTPAWIPEWHSWSRQSSYPDGHPPYGTWIQRFCSFRLGRHQETGYRLACCAQ